MLFALLLLFTERKCEKYLLFCQQENQFGVKVESWFAPSLFPVSSHTSGTMRMEANTERLIFQNSQVWNEGLWMVQSGREGTGLFAATQWQPQVQL